MSETPGWVASRTYPDWGGDRAAPDQELSPWANAQPRPGTSYSSPTQHGRAPCRPRLCSPEPHMAPAAKLGAEPVGRVPRGRLCEDPLRGGLAWAVHSPVAAAPETVVPEEREPAGTRGGPRVRSVSLRCSCPPPPLPPRCPGSQLALNGPKATMTQTTCVGGRSRSSVINQEFPGSLRVPKTGCCPGI